MNPIAHIEVNVSSLETSKKFYELVLTALGWKMNMETSEVVGFKAPDKTHLFLVQADEKYLADKFHRKHVGINHLAFRVESKTAVDIFCKFLSEHNISRLYTEEPKDYSSEYGMNEYLAVFFEDPDRIKLEVVYME
jgi:catechol 2,3-dioxygenase-like lactoylglutathione lyase family enzyme